MARVTLQRLRKEYRGGAVAVRDLSLEIADGEFLALVGPSGCGKSTTLNLIAGLDAPTSGSVLIDGRDVTAASPGARDIAMVFQSYALYPHLDVRGNLAFPLQVARRPRDEIERRVREAAEMLGLADLLARKPRELSGGQRQRVALGRALVREPKVFLFDEPLSNLDAGLRLQLRAELKLLHARLRTTFIYVTHDQGEAMTLASRIVVMDRGEARQAASPREIYERPASRFVAELFGSPRINVVAPAVLGLPARAALVGVRPESLEILALSHEKPEPPAGSEPADRARRLVQTSAAAHAQPEAFARGPAASARAPGAVAPGPDASARGPAASARGLDASATGPAAFAPGPAQEAHGAVDAVVRLVELTGAESWVSLDVAGQRLVARAAADFDAAPGTAVRVRARQVLWFDADGNAVPV